MTHLRVWLLFPILLFALAATSPASAQQAAPTATPLRCLPGAGKASRSSSVTCSK